MQQVRADVRWIADVEGLSTSSRDGEWLARCGREGWLAVTRDKKIRNRPAERRAVIANDVGLFVLAHTRNLSPWEQLQIMAAKIEQMETIFDEEEKPFIYTLTGAGPDTTLAKYLLTFQRTART